MSQAPPHQPGCLEPRLGRLLDGYFERTLSRKESELFESHYFVCPACLEEARHRQDVAEATIQRRPLMRTPAAGEEALAGASGSTRERADADIRARGTVLGFRWRPPSAGLVAAASLVVVAGVVLGLLVIPPDADRGAGESERPFSVHLEGTFRGGAAVSNRVPAGRRLELSMSFPVSRRPGVVYDAVVRDAQGKDVFTAEALSAASPHGIIVSVPEGIGEPGRYQITVTERLPGEGGPADGGGGTGGGEASGKGPREGGDASRVGGEGSVAGSDDREGRPMVMRYSLEVVPSLD